MFSSVPTSVSWRPVVAQRTSATGRSFRAVRHHLARDRFDSLHAHQHHLRAAEFRQRRIIDRALGFLRIFVAGEKSDVRIFRAMRHRNSGVGRPGDRRGNSRHNFKFNSGIDDRFCFFRAASKNKRIAALQPDNLFSCARLFDQEHVDFFLTEGVFAGLLSDVNDLCIITRPTQHFWIRQMIVHDHVRLLDALLRAQRDQAEIARPGPDQIKLSPSFFYWP